MNSQLTVLSEVAEDLRKLEGTRMAIGSSDDMAKVYDEGCRDFVRKHGPSLFDMHAAPQPRDVRGTEDVNRLVAAAAAVMPAPWKFGERVEFLGGKWTELGDAINAVIATTPQDAAGVGPGCLPFETVSMVADALTILGGAVPEGGEEKAARADELVRTLCHEVGRLFSRTRDGGGATAAVWDAFSALEDTPFGEHASAKHIIRPYLQGGDVLGWRLVDGIKVFGIVPASGLFPLQDFVRYDDHLAALTTPPPGVDVGKLRELVAEARSSYRDSDAAGDVLDFLEERIEAIDAAAPGVGNG
ncbi:hypothetical protein M8R20_46125 [Pseudomonas sp. R2.Fl]|nr:hypothetical protein [Pseudomonas sp. R2.Fl]MCL6714369.1 hypothetical protein [Pseudomonas sp. R2.Fl]